METLMTERDHIRDVISKVSKLYSDGKTPSDEDIQKLEDELYNNLFNYRDSKKESPLDRPAAYPLTTIFKELKFGRPALSQQYLQKCIEELESN